MSHKILSQIKKVQSNIKVSKTLPLPVVETQKEVQAINTLVKGLLKKENHMLLPSEVQAHVIRGLMEVNRLFAELKNQCRSDYHFQLNQAQFLNMMQVIQNMSFCIHLSLENGFYEIEPRGGGLYESIELSWLRVKEIYRSFTQKNTTEYIPPYLLNNLQLQKFVHDLYDAIAPQAGSVLKFKKASPISQHFTLEELKGVNRYFKLVFDFNRFIDQQRLNRKIIQVARESTKINSTAALLKEFHQVEYKIQRYSPGNESLIMIESFYFDDATAHDLHARLNSLYIQLEASRVLTERYQHLKGLRVDDSGVIGMDTFQKKIEFEKKQLRFFMENLTRLHHSLLSMNSILANFSISFGKIYQLSLKNNLSAKFVERAFLTAHNLLSNAMKFANARRLDSQHLQSVLAKTTIFQKTVEGVIVSALKELEEAKQEIERYDEKIVKLLKQVTSGPDRSVQFMQNSLQVAYDERSELSSAAICLNNIDTNFDLLIKELLKINQAYQGLKLSPTSNGGEGPSVEAMLRTLEIASECPPKLLKELWQASQDLDWLIEEILLIEVKEERRFVAALQAFIEPIKQRIEAEKTAQKQKIIKPAEQRPPVKKEKTEKGAVTENQKSSTPAAKPVRQAPETPAIEKKVKKPAVNQYDPFQPKTMEILKKACRTVDGEKILSILEVLERPHAFFNFLEHLEEEYDPYKPHTESYYLEELMESQSAMDFFLGFAKVKFLPYGYFSASGEKFSYDNENQRFEVPNNSEVYLKISGRSLETPKGIFIRLMRICLGYDEAITLNINENPEIVNLMKMDHIITSEEKQKLHDIIAFVS